MLLNLVRKELKVKYTGSVLGAVWSLLNPVVFLAVFTFVAKVLGAAAKDYAEFLLAGLLAWNLFSVSLTSGAISVISNANLVKKVSFPREILPLATVGVALVDFALQSLVFFAFLAVLFVYFHHGARVHHKQAHGFANLRCGKAHAMGVVHGFVHVGNQLL